MKNNSFKRDPRSGALINTDDSGYQAAKARKRLFEKAGAQTEQIRKDVDNLNQEMADMKNMLGQILRKLEEK